ncbi:YdjC-like protein [Reichenbachiella faecimaris]|uniref:YdjC-like protein n=1 Tax=Reichenbachiella faecimaris TaxID=692418 RepID=A0A1W2G537_REIFA|nr:ChbG/HpnK family deacetylase [Reichenbachiella faecimaris]SMD31787.1 YdjC-like protein [Reichenbachiella faecimaris]
MAKLIFTADDFGVVPAIDKGIVYAAAHGLINSVATFTNRDGFENSVEKLLAANANIDVGVHLTICSGYALTDATYFTDKHSKFKHYGNIKRPKQAHRSDELSQLETEITAQIDRLVAILPDQRVKHLSVHFNSLYFVKDYFDVLVKVANSYHPVIPIRSVHAKPGIKHDFFVGQMAFQIAFKNLFRQKDVDHIDEFAEEIGVYTNQMASPPKMPDLFHSAHYGPLGLVKLTEHRIKKLAKKKRMKLYKTWEKLQPNEVCEYVFHLIDDNYSLLDGYQGSVDYLDYDGINTKYFDSRMAELKSLKLLKEEGDFGLFNQFTSWTKL